MIIEELELRHGFDPFRYDVQSQCLGHRDDGLHDRCIIGVARNVAHK